MSEGSADIDLAYPPDSGGQAIKGPGAQAAAVVTLGAALFCHARWFWGLREGSYWTFERLTILASLIMIGGMGAMFWFELLN